MRIELSLAAAAFLTWCLVSAAWKSLLPKGCDGDVRLIWREDTLHNWHEVPTELVPDEVRAHLSGNIDDVTYATLLDIATRACPAGTATVQFAAVLTTGVHPSDVLFISDVHPARLPHDGAISAAPLLIHRPRRRRLIVA
ncbi:MAG: hypothetical protein ACSLE6_16015 [Mycobacterium sp.]